MIDPVTAVAAATKSYAMVRALVEAGREAHDVMSQIGCGTAMLPTYCMPIKKLRKSAPSKKLFLLRALKQKRSEPLRLKKIEAQRKEIVELINLAYGAQGLEEFRDIRKQVVRERREMVYAQQEMRETILSGILIFVMVAIFVALVLFIVSA